jgi:hypothetical protein
MKSSILTALLVVLSGCAAYDLSETGQFTPRGDGFEFRSIADTIYPAESPRAEAQRIARLEQYLTQTGTCPTGYRVTERHLVQRFGPGLIGDGIHDVVYFGVCL